MVFDRPAGTVSGAASNGDSCRELCSSDAHGDRRRVAVIRLERRDSAPAPTTRSSSRRGSRGTNSRSPSRSPRPTGRRKTSGKAPGWMRSIALGIAVAALDTTHRWRCAECFAPNPQANPSAHHRNPCPIREARHRSRTASTTHGPWHATARSLRSPLLFSSLPSSCLERDTTNAIPLEWIEFYAPDEASGEARAPVLFLHGLLGSKRNFATCATMLARQIDKKRRIIGVDLRNHGDTQPWSENMSYPSMAQDVVQFLQSQNIENAILVGHSMGGKVAQALALLHPEYVAGLVVLDIAPVTYTRDADPHWRAVEDILRTVHGVIEDAEATGEEPNKREIDRSLRKSIPDPALRAFVLTNYDSRNNQWKVPIGTMVKELEQIAGFDLTPDSEALVVNEPSSSLSSTYEGDVFIINGGQSRFVRHAYMDQIASYFPNHMLTTIRGSGHWVHAEAPDDLVALLKRYLDR